MGEGPFKDQTQLIIVDRGYDPVAPVVHELTYQAMVMDLVEIDNDVIRYTTVNDHGVTVNKEVILDDNDSMWVEYRKALQAVVLFSFHQCDILTLSQDWLYFKNWARMRSLKYYLSLYKFFVISSRISNFV